MKKIAALALALVMAFALTTVLAEAPAEEKVYTVIINEVETTFTVAADQQSVTVDAMGMTVRGSCEVLDGVLTFKDQTTGNAMIWASLGKSSYALNDAAGTAAAVVFGEVSRFAGEYDLYCEEKDMYCEEFIIDEDGTVHGVVESSGLTSFEGTINAYGIITAEVTRLGGTMTGTVSEDLQVSVHFEVRGSTSDFVGGPL